MSDVTLDLTNDEILDLLTETEMIPSISFSEQTNSQQSMSLTETMEPQQPQLTNLISHTTIEKLSKHLNFKYNFYYENYQAMCLITEKLTNITKECEEKEHQKKQKEMELESIKRSLEESINEQNKILNDINVIYINCGFK